MSQDHDDKEVSSFEKLVDEGPVGQDKLLNEDEILSEEEKKKPEPIQNPEGKAKKPCANCTCGLADQLEMEAKERSSIPDDNTQSSSSAAKSSCNSCYLGDAFRCASCPYRGMPAFKPGEKVMIDTTSDDL